MIVIFIKQGNVDTEIDMERRHREKMKVLRS
jgi:hypothetical protein